MRWYCITYPPLRLPIFSDHSTERKTGVLHRSAQLSDAARTTLRLDRAQDEDRPGATSQDGPFQRCQSQSAPRTRNDPTTADTTSRNEILTVSSAGKSPSSQNSRPPTRAPTKPSPKFRQTPKPLRSRLMISPAMLPPIRPTIIQTTNCFSETISASAVVRNG